MATVENLVTDARRAIEEFRTNFPDVPDRLPRQESRCGGSSSLRSNAVSKRRNKMVSKIESCVKEESTQKTSQNQQSPVST